MRKRSSAFPTLWNQPKMNACCILFQGAVTCREELQCRQAAPGNQAGLGGMEAVARGCATSICGDNGPQKPPVPLDCKMPQLQTGPL
ncbi:hypothetical protein P4O66_006902, partial [Electrophorus voltai]